jgi:hypothetical protein
MRWGKPTKNKKRRDPRYFLNESAEEVEDEDDIGWPSSTDYQEWDRSAEADWRAEVAVKKEAFLTSGVQARWVDEFAIDDDDEEEMVLQVLSDAYDKIWEKI